MREELGALPDQALAVSERTGTPAPPTSGGFTRQVRFLPAYDHLSAIPNGGIGNMRIVFVLVGPEGAVDWEIGTGWYVPSAVAHLSKFPRAARDDARAPTGYYLGFHSGRPLYEGQEAADGECEIVRGGVCYRDGSYLAGDWPLAGFVAGGDDYLWPALEAHYRHLFEGAPHPFLENTDASQGDVIEPAQTEEQDLGSPKTPNGTTP